MAFEKRILLARKGGDEQKRRKSAANSEPRVSHMLSSPLSLSLSVRRRRRNGRRTIQSTADCKNKRDPVFSLHFDLRRGLWLLSISGRRRRRHCRRGKPISRNAPVRCTVSLSSFFLSFSLSFFFFWGEGVDRCIDLCEMKRAGKKEIVAPILLPNPFVCVRMYVCMYVYKGKIKWCKCGE